MSTFSLPTATAPTTTKGSLKGIRVITTPRVIRWVAVSLALVLFLAALNWGIPVLMSRFAPQGTVDPGIVYTVTPRTFDVTLKEKGELKAAKSTDIICEVEGRSTIISLIPEGTPVKKGDLLIELASNQIDDRIQQEELKEANAITAFEAAKSELDIQRDKNASDIRKAQLEIELKELELNKYAEGESEQRLKDAQIDIDQAQMTLDRRRQDFIAAQELVVRKFITQTEFDEAEFNFRKAQWDLEKAHNAKDVLVTYTHVAELRRRESDLEEARKESERTRKNAEAEETKKLRALEGREKELELTQSELARLRLQKEKCRITAPTPGFVIYYSGNSGRWSMNDTQIKEGVEVHERQILMQLPDTSRMTVALRIHEAKTYKLTLDQRVRVMVEGFPGQVLAGHVSKIAAVADSQSGWLNPDLKEYETEVLLDPTDLALKPGITANAEILVETVEQKLAVPVQSIYAKGRLRFTFVKTGRTVNPQPVRLGALGTELAEIVEGLNPNDQVLLAFTDEYKRMIPDEPMAPDGSPVTRAANDGIPGSDASTGTRGGVSSPRPGRPPGERRPEGRSRRGGNPTAAGRSSG